jgi:hypothetical protein
MIEKIYLQLADESGNTVAVPEDDYSVGIKLDYAIAHLYAAITNLHSETKDEEIKLAEKFAFADNLQKYLEEYRNEHVF